MPIWPERPDNEFKSFVYEQFSRIGKAFSAPARLIILNILCQGEHTVEIRTALQEISKSPSRLHPVYREELLKRLNEEDTVIVDVRPEQEYQQGHLPGAVSVPLEELERRLSELPEDKGIVAYCRGRYCILADQAVELLLAKGYRAQRADEGVVEWKIDGMPVEKS